MNSGMEIAVLSWNMNGRDGLERVSVIADSQQADIVLLSFQECFSPSQNKVRRIMAKAFPHYSVASVNRVCGLWSVVLCKTSGCARDVEVNTMRIGLGVLGMINKGACISKLSNGVVFVSCHLSAHLENNERRMQQIRTVFECINDKETVSNTRLLVIAGDMNFRMTQRMSFDTQSIHDTNESVIGSSINRALYENSESIYKAEYDQFNKFNKLYPMFHEDKITFMPTYKYEMGSNCFSNKQNPSWCDRVLVSSCNVIQFTKYITDPSVMLSDHKPIVCKFNVAENMSDECQRQAVPDVGYKSHVFTRIATWIYCFMHEYYSIMLIIAVVPVFVVVLIKAINARLKNDTNTDVKI
ncbi:phosphatidylinositol 5-phosphate phosphatase [Ordospora colligata]|nr:phosphatidylinositol 5-phosphate phosphatase [Ordospora colligata]